MQEQFENMKNSFLVKIKNLEEEGITFKTNSRRKIYNLEEELKQAVYLKDIFLRQITEYQKIYDIH